MLESGLPAEDAEQVLTATPSLRDAIMQTRLLHAVVRSPLLSEIFPLD
jgi:hypothetical protein